MKCHAVAIEMPDGTTARGIVCSRDRVRRCECGNVVARDCDWKLTEGRRAGKTCDRGLCLLCTSSPCVGKDLCAEHAAAWAVHPKNPARQVVR